VQNWALDENRYIPGVQNSSRRFAFVYLRMRDELRTSLNRRIPAFALDLSPIGEVHRGLAAGLLFVVPEPPNPFDPFAGLRADPIADGFLPLPVLELQIDSVFRLHDFSFSESTTLRDFINLIRWNHDKGTWKNTPFFLINPDMGLFGCAF
jgi:hypothetical protein